MDAMRAMLDELMGKERDLPPERRTKDYTKFSDSEVCKYALCGLCPYGLFKNTKSDLGACKYEIHEEQLGWEELQQQWDQLSERDKDRYGYDRELLQLLEQLTRDMDRKIERQRERADKESAPREPGPADRARLEALLARQKEALDQSGRLAEQGEIDASLEAAQSAEEMKKQHDHLLKQVTQPERIMSVCEVCGVFINSTDNEQRRLDHLTGKQFLGWKAIRDHLAVMQERMKTRGGSGGGGGEYLPPAPSSRGREGRSRSRERERGSRERGSGRRERDEDDDYPRRSRERGSSRRSRSRSRGRDTRGSRHRSRSRDRHRDSRRRDYDRDSRYRH